MRRIVGIVLLVLVVVLVAIQFVPYGRDHDNPAVTGTPKWEGRNTARFVETACGDCHSNKTQWPWYASVAPASWLVQSDVDDGRAALNFSEWDKPQPAAGKVVSQIRDGEMPPWRYRLLHSNAQLSDGEKRTLVDGLATTYKRDAPPIRKGGEGEGD